MTDLLLDTDLGPEQREYAATARASGEQLLTVINDVLDVSKIEAGRLELEERDFDLYEAVETTCDVVAATAHGKGLELVVGIADDVPRAVRGDRGRLAQVLTNLLSNAVKFTAEGEVVVDIGVQDVEHDLTTVRFTVSDTGIGIAERDLERLFESFAQADVSTTRRFGGTGLGLTISRQLVGLMGGGIAVRSAVGEGSTFTFTIPLPPAKGELRTLPPQVELRGLRALVVDDARANRRVLQAYLTSWGMRVTCAAGGDEALRDLNHAASRGEPYELAVLDYNMPGMDGVELARRITATPSLRSLRLVMLTSSGSGQAAARAAGVSEVLTKPVRQSRLYDALASALHEALGGTHADAMAMEWDDDVAPHADGALILVAEDHDVNRLLMDRLLTRRGHRMVTAATGREAIDLVAREDVDLVFMDCQMPELDGYEATRRLRARESATGRRRVPIVAMTAHAMAGDRERCIAAGMDDYLAKPLRPEEVDGILERWLGHGTVNGVPYSSVARELVARALDEARFDDLGRDFPPEIVREVVQTFLDTTPPLIERTGVAATAGDHAGVEAAAHRLKGGCLAVGAGALTELAMQLEGLGKDQANVDTLRDAAAQLGDTWVATEVALRERLGI